MSSLRGCGLPAQRWVPLQNSGTAWKARKLRQCRNRFLCPYCSWWFRRELADRTTDRTVELVEQRGGMAYSVFSFSHRPGEQLGAVWPDLMASWRELGKMGRVRGRPSLVKQLGLGGGGVASVRFPDIVVGGPNGAHPHFNVIHEAPLELVPCQGHGPANVGPVVAAYQRQRADELSAYSDLLTDAWAAAVLKVCGRHVSGSVGVRTVLLDLWGTSREDIEVVAGYSSKDLSRAGFEAVENRYRSAEGGFTLMEAVVLASIGHVWAQRLVAEASSALRGTSSYRTSRAWAEGCWDPPDEEEDAMAVGVDDVTVCEVKGRWVAQNRDRFGRLLDELQGLDAEAGAALIGRTVPTEAVRWRA